MKTLEEFNNEKTNHYNNTSTKNGISCPKCGKEMCDTNPMMVLMSSPPQMDVHCDCGFRGFRIA